MTTDTSNLPERIWASEVALFNSGRSAGSYYTDRYSSPAGNEYATEYVRADLLDAMQARAEKAEAAIKHQARAAMVLRKITLDELEQLRAENERLLDSLQEIVRWMPKRNHHSPNDESDVVLCGREKAVNQARAALDRKEGGDG